MKIKLSKSDWELIGAKTGWLNVEAKKKKDKKDKKGYKHSPKEHGFIDECLKKNKDKDNAGAYCASIVDKVKGTTDWRKGPKKD